MEQTRDGVGAQGVSRYQDVGVGGGPGGGGDPE